MLETRFESWVLASTYSEWEFRESVQSESKRNRITVCGKENANQD